MEAEKARYSVREGPDGEQMFYVTLYRPRSNLTVRIGQPEPPLYALVDRTQTVLVVGMGMALVLALLGSWLATYQVVTPLKRIRNSARAVGLGRFEGKIEIDSRAAEFQDLAESLNRASDAFREKIDELERLTQLQSEFIGNVSHEVRNPIHAIGGYLEALSSPSLPPDQSKKYAEKALKNLHRLQTLFDDLIDNALAYTPEGTVRCRTRKRLDKVRIEVVDTGQGIDEEHLERIFDRFYRAESHRARKSGGTGLGLSIVQQILQAHGEEICVESTKGRGTRFWFELPHAPEAKPEAQTVEA